METTTRRRHSLLWTLLALALAATIAFVDAVTGDDAVLIGVLAVAPLIPAAYAGVRETIVVGAAAVALAVALGVPNDFFFSSDHLIRTGVLTLVTVVAVWIARLRIERESAARRLRTEHAVSRLLAETPVLTDATPGLLRAIGETLELQFGAIWTVVPRQGRLRCVETWHVEDPRLERFEEITRDFEYDPGVGVPGRVWLSGEPTWIVNVDADDNVPRAPAALEAGLQGALGFPIRTASGVLGAIEFLSAEPMSPDDELTEMMAGFGAQIGEYIERKRAEEAVERSEAVMGAMLIGAHDAIITIDHRGIVTEFNPAAERTFGHTREAAVGRELAELVIPPGLREGHRQGLRRYLETGQAAVLDRRLELVGMRKDGSELPVELTITRIPVGGPPTFAGYIRDITDRKRAESERRRLLESEREARIEAEEAQRQAAFLAEAGTLLDAELDFESTLERLARISVPYLADWCTIDTFAADGTFKRLAVAHVDPAKEEFAWELSRRYPAEPREDRGSAHVMRTGEPELYKEIPDEMLEEAAQDEEHLRLMRELGLRSAMVLPVRARGRTLGAISFITAESGRTYDERDLARAQDLVRRGALSVDNARLYGERSYIARTLQESLLPPHLPPVPGIEVAARFRAAGQGNEVGGDFYDLFNTGGGQWGVVLGDVCGKGADAAAVTALARYTLRTVGMGEGSPAQNLAMLNEALLRQRSDRRFCTVVYGCLTVRGAGPQVEVSSGGHPLPLLLRPDGRVDPVGEPGTLLGVVPDPELADRTVELGTGDTLVFYTDGVSEAGAPDRLLGDEGIVSVLEGCRGLDAEAVADRLEQAATAAANGDLRDDVAILVLRVNGAATTAE